MTDQPMAAPAPQLRALGVGDIVDRVFAIYRAKPWLFLAVATVPYLALVLVFIVLGIVFAATLVAYASTFNSIAQGTPVSPNTLSGMIVGFGALALFVIIVAVVIFSAQSAALVAAMAARYLGRDITLGQAFRMGLGASPRLIGAGLLLFIVLLVFWTVCIIVAALSNQGLVVFLVVLAGIIGTIYILASTIVMPVVATLEGAGPVSALRRSWELSEGNRWRILGLQALLALLNIVISVLLSTLFVGLLVGDATTRAVLQQIVSLVANVAWAPVQWGTFAVLYYDLRVRREGYDLQLAAEALPRTP